MFGQDTVVILNTGARAGPFAVNVYDVIAEEMYNR